MKMKVLSVFLASMLACSVMGGAVMAESASEASTQEAAAAEDLEAARKAADLIDKIYVQERTETTDEDCKAAKEAWDALTDAQKELVSGQYADPDYFGRDTGDAGADDPLNEDGIGEKEILVVSFGTSFNDSRARDILVSLWAIQLTGVRIGRVCPYLLRANRFARWIPERACRP